MKIQCPHCGGEITLRARRNVPTQRQLLAWAYCCIYEMTQQEAAKRMGVTQQNIHYLLQELNKRWPGFVIRNMGGAKKYSLIEDADSIHKEKLMNDYTCN